MANTKSTLSVRLGLVQLQYIKNWIYFANIHNLNSLEYDDNDIISYFIQRVYDEESLFSRMSLITNKNMVNIIPQMPGNLNEKIQQYLPSDMSISKTFRIIPEISSMLDSIAEKENEKNKSVLVKKIIEVGSNPEELIRFLIRNSLVSIISTAYISFLKGKIINDDLKNFILYNKHISNKNTKFENDIITNIILRFKKISNYDLDEFITALKKAGAAPPSNDLYANIVKNLASIKESDMAPYTKNDAILPLTELETIDEFLLPLFEILNVYAMTNLISTKIPSPAQLYPILISKMYVSSNGKINVSQELYITIQKSFDEFKFLLNKENENLRNLIN